MHLTNKYIGTLTELSVDLYQMLYIQAILVQTFQ